MIGMTLTDNIHQSHGMVWGHRTAPHTFREIREILGNSKGPLPELRDLH